MLLKLLSQFVFQLLSQLVYQLLSQLWYKLLSQLLLQFLSQSLYQLLSRWLLNIFYQIDNGRSCNYDPAVFTFSEDHIDPFVIDCISTMFYNRYTFNSHGWLSTMFYNRYTYVFHYTYCLTVMDGMLIYQHHI